jgi:glycyl-radical enzyme activating protein
VKAVVFDVKKFAVHDGPGIRTTLFLKGCPLKCLWCHNPEGISSDITLWYFENKCINCHTCLKSCPQDALSAGTEVSPSIIIDHEKCNNCGICVDKCPTGALAFDGYEMDSDKAVDLLLQDEVFYKQSQGGITISGGDPLFQHEFCRDVLTKCRDRGIHTAIETSMQSTVEILESFIGLVDLFIVDLKIFNEKEHKRYIGAGNRLIFSNFKFLVEKNQNLLVRIPLIPGITATEENLRSIARFVADNSEGMSIELINFNPLAINKYRLMGAENMQLQNMKPFSETELENFYSILETEGITAVKETSVSI